jgi:hypothetical protein
LRYPAHQPSPLRRVLLHTNLKASGYTAIGERRIYGGVSERLRTPAVTVAAKAIPSPHPPPRWRFGSRLLRHRRTRSRCFWEWTVRWLGPVRGEVITMKYGWCFPRIR